MGHRIGGGIISVYQMEWLKIITVLGIGSAISLASEPCTTVADNCPPMWQRWRDSCYRLTTQGAAWDAQQSACSDMGGKMAAPHSPEENEFFASMAKGAGLDWLWVACSDRDKEGEWICEGQEKGSTFLNFAPGEPNNSGGKEHCAHIRDITSGGRHWNDVPCSNVYGAICVLRSPPQARQQCYSGGNNQQAPKACLIGHVIREFATRSNFKCAAACIKEPRCRSFNVISTDQGKSKMCQLNDAILSDYSAKFEDDKSFCSYYSVNY